MRRKYSKFCIRFSSQVSCHDIRSYCDTTFMTHDIRNFYIVAALQLLCMVQLKPWTTIVSPPMQQEKSPLDFRNTSRILHDKNQNIQ